MAKISYGAVHRERRGFFHELRKNRALFLMLLPGVIVDRKSVV